ncbi:MAG: hypothetical protein JO112_21325, partial [Planctomycetes bacterium]|nr:hypothetical protein [Planctomycetota bacterium]
MRRGMHLAILITGALVLTGQAVQAAGEDPIQLAIDRGVTYLKKTQNFNGTTPQNVGAAALNGLALLECGVPADDPAVQRAAEVVRESSVGLTYTYSLALSILFLDRLGDPDDVPLIQSLTVRLLAGQKADHGWTYECPPISEAEMHRLSSLVQQHPQLTARNTAPQNSLPGKRLASPLPREIKDQLKLLSKMAPAPMITDNSNTQFATLALWVARRYDLPVDRALERVELRFRNSQNADGGWGYFPLGRGMNLSTPTMTCAGLLGLAVAHGVTNARLHASTTLERNPPARNNSFRDPAIRAGLVAAGATIGYPVGNKKDPRHPVPIIGRGGRGFYYLWSLERVAVIYGLKTINKKDWYAWGSEILLASQLTDGSWQGQYPEGGVDTCFALLFLRRANLAQDLTVSLRGQVFDPGDLNLPGATPPREVPNSKVLGTGLNPDGKPEGGPSQGA